MSNIIVEHTITRKSKLLRGLWVICYYLFFRPFSTKIFRVWRNFVLRVFGAKIHHTAGVYCSASIWAPWNLIMEENSWIGPGVICYNVGQVVLRKNVTVSQRSHLCTASHNIYSKKHELLVGNITLESESWVGAEAFIFMGVIIGKGSVVGARACVFKDVIPMVVVGGNPSKIINKREYRNE